MVRRQKMPVGIEGSTLELESPECNPSHSQCVEVEAARLFDGAAWRSAERGQFFSRAANYSLAH